MPKCLSRGGLDIHPLQGSSFANMQDDALFHADHGFNLTPPLPAGLFTPPKPPKNPFGQHSNHMAQSSAASLSGRDMQYSLFDQSRNRVSFSANATPTSIFRRLKTSSPEDAAEQHSQCRFDSFAYTQNVNPNGVPSGLSYMAPVPQKRSRPVQRGIHPAEINKRITGASDSWQILDIVNTFGAEFDAVNVATALHRIAKQRPEDAMHLTNSNAFKQLVIMVDVQVRHLLFSGELERVSIASHPTTFQALPSSASSHCDAALLRASQMDMLSDTGLTALILQAEQCKPQQIANILWAFGTLSYKPQEHLLNVLANQAVSKLSDFNPQNLANFIWAYARYVTSPCTVLALSLRCPCMYHSARIQCHIMLLQQLLIEAAGCNRCVSAP